MSIRDDRALAIRRRLRDLGDDHARAMPLLLDDLDAIDRQAMASWRYRVGGTMYEAADVAIIAPGDDPAELHAASHVIPSPVKPAAEPGPAARPAPRRRTVK